MSNFIKVKCKNSDNEYDYINLDLVQELRSLREGTRLIFIGIMSDDDVAFQDVYDTPEEILASYEN